MYELPTFVPTSSVRNVWMKGVTAVMSDFISGWTYRVFHDILTRIE